MKPLKFRTVKTPSRSTSEREFYDAEKRLVGIRVQVDLPRSQGGYQKGIIRKLTREHMVLVECDGAWGTVWVDLSVVTALEEY